MSSVTLKVETARGLLFATVGGIVTRTEIEKLRSRLRPAFVTAKAGCVDYSSAVLALTECDLAALAAGARPSVDGAAIAWLVAEPETADRWRDLALEFALVGLRRFATCDPAEARWWMALQSRKAAVPQ